MLFRGLTRRAGTLQFPFLAGAVMASWFLPQAMLLMDRGELPSGGYDMTMMMAMFCMIAVLFGTGRVSRLDRPEKEEHDERRLLHAAVGLSVIGATAYALILQTPVTQTADGLTTGIVTIYFFLFKAQYFGLAISLLILFQRFSFTALALVAFNVMTMSGFILFGGRRGPMVELAMITFCALWFQRRVAPPRFLFVIIIIGSALFFNMIGEYRSLVQRTNENAGGQLPKLSEVLEINFIESFLAYSESRTHEVRNAIYAVAAAAKELEFTFGAEYWNFFVFRYVPGQFVGHDLKAALQFSIDDQKMKIFGYRVQTGTTSTGIADAFTSFSFFGAFVFALISYLFRKLWVKAMKGSIRAKYYYCILITTGLHGITHGTNWFIVFLLQAYLFSWPMFWFARKKIQAGHEAILQSDVRQS